MFTVWCLLILALSYGHVRVRRFPKDFNWGVGTSAFQIEGAWNLDGKGPNIWDTFTHKIPSTIFNNNTADIACDSYHRYKEDVRNAYYLGIKFYRFSISWARVLPTGYANQTNELGITYYKNLVDEILRYNMVPVATLYHWDLPQRLYDDGVDWTSPKLIKVFVDYARLIISRLPKVGVWTTINEPKQVCHMGYGLGYFAPGVKSDGLLEYQCAYILIKVHAATYHMYKREFPNYKAKMSIVVDCQWGEPLLDNLEDRDASDRQMQFECGLYIHPIYNGDWPKIVKQRVDDRSKQQNLTKSRLPSFTQQEIDYIKGTYDYLGINQYFTTLVSSIKKDEQGFSNYEYDIGVVHSLSPNWRLEANLWAIVPFGVRKVLNWIKLQYNNPEILITEMGMSDDGNSLIDNDRIDFYNDYCCNILDAMYIDKVTVTGMVAWSLMDNFEWAEGYRYHFGLYHIDFDKDPSLKRVPKKSVGFFKDLATSGKIRCDDTRPKHWKWIQSRKKKHRKHHSFRLTKDFKV